MKTSWHPEINCSASIDKPVDITQNMHVGLVSTGKSGDICGTSFGNMFKVCN